MHENQQPEYFCLLFQWPRTGYSCSYLPVTKQEWSRVKCPTAAPLTTFSLTSLFPQLSISLFKVFPSFMNSKNTVIFFKHLPERIV